MIYKLGTRLQTEITNRRYGTNQPRICTVSCILFKIFLLKLITENAVSDFSHSHMKDLCWNENMKDTQNYLCSICFCSMYSWFCAIGLTLTLTHLYQLTSRLGLI